MTNKNRSIEVEELSDKANRNLSALNNQGYEITEIPADVLAEDEPSAMCHNCGRQDLEDEGIFGFNLPIPGPMLVYCNDCLKDVDRKTVKIQTALLAKKELESQKQEEVEMHYYD